MKGKDSLKDAIYNAILESIISQEYRPNQVLKEKTLVEKYGCSKSPVREALVSLCNDNVLRNIPRYGYEVVRLTVEDIQEMLQFRLVLEGGLLSANCEKFGAAQLDCLEQIDQACRSATDDIWSHWAFNTEFHLRMTAFCGNNYALDQLQRCMDRLKRAYAQFYWGKPQAALAFDTKNHSAILHALQAKDLDAILQYLKDDLNDFGGEHSLYPLRL